MELTIGVAIGSSIQVRPGGLHLGAASCKRKLKRACTLQIAVGLIPALVIVGWIINKDLTLFFE